MANLESFLSSTIATFLHQMRIRKGVAKFTLAAAATLTARSPNFLNIDPGGATRTVTLPAEADAEGLAFLIYNSGGAGEDLTVQNDTPATVVTVNPNEMAVVACDGTTWHKLALTSVDLGSSLLVDVIGESTAAAGVTVDGVLLKDGAVTGARTAANTTAVAIVGATVLTLDDSGGIFSVDQGSTYDIDLPSPTTGPGLRYVFYLTGPAAFSPTITVAGAAATFVGTIVNDVTSVLPATGATLTFATGAAALGDSIEIISISTTLYLVRAVSSAAGGITIA